MASFSYSLANDNRNSPVCGRNRKLSATRKRPRNKFTLIMEDSMKEASIRALLPKDLEGREEIAAQLYAAMNAGVESAANKSQAEIDKLSAKLAAAETAKNEAEEALNAALADESADDALKAANAKIAELEASLQAEQDAHSTTKTGYDEKESKAAATAELTKALTAKRMPEEFVEDFIAARVDFAQLKRDKDGKLTNVDKYVESLAEAHPAKFLVSEERKFEAGDPPPSGDGKTDPFITGFDSE